MSRPDLDLDDLERKAREATPGPWRVDGYDCETGQHAAVVRSAAPDEQWDPVPQPIAECDAEYIAAANPATVLALCAEVRRLREYDRPCARCHATTGARSGPLNADFHCSSCVREFVAERDLLREQRRDLARALAETDWAQGHAGVAPLDGWPNWREWAKGE